MHTTIFPQALFAMGQIFITPGALDTISPAEVVTLLHRHVSGDWGDLCAEDVRENEFSLLHGFRLFSAYNTQSGKVWLITEADRSSTTVLLPSEY